MRCTSRGGRALGMTVTGSGNFTSTLDNIQAVGTTQRMGDDSFFSTTHVISIKKDMDEYWCMAWNGLSSTPRDNVMLRG